MLLLNKIELKKTRKEVIYTTSKEPLTNKMSNLCHRVLHIPGPPTENDMLIAAINTAHKDLCQAENTFNQMKESDLIDYAIYDMMSARVKYSYLLKIAKEKELHL